MESDNLEASLIEAWDCITGDVKCEDQKPLFSSVKEGEKTLAYLDMVNIVTFIAEILSFSILQIQQILEINISDLIAFTKKNELDKHDDNDNDDGDDDDDDDGEEPITKYIEELMLEDLSNLSKQVEKAMSFLQNDVASLEKKRKKKRNSTKSLGSELADDNVERLSTTEMKNLENAIVTIDEIATIIEKFEDFFMVKSFVSITFEIT
jgi:hypothetical protein